MVFGLLMLVGAVRFMARGWIRELYVLPRFHFTYDGFGWVRPLPEWGLWLVFVALAALSLAIALGFAYRLSMGAFCLLFTYVELLDKTTYLNHYYFISVLSLLLLFLPLNGRASLDTRLGWATPRATVPAWMVWIVRLQLGFVYFYAGLAKLNRDWLLDAQPLRIWLHARTATPLIGLLGGREFLPHGAIALQIIGSIDDDGYLRIVDRKKDMILVSGFNVYPNEVEAAMAEHPDVLECAVVGLPDANSGEKVALYVVPKKPVSKEELSKFAEQNLAGYKRPRHIEFRDTLPKTNVGKILRRELRDEALKETAK